MGGDRLLLAGRQDDAPGAGAPAPTGEDVGRLRGAQGGGEVVGALQAPAAQLVQGPGQADPGDPDPGRPGVDAQLQGEGRDHLGGHRRRAVDGDVAVHQAQVDEDVRPALVAAQGDQAGAHARGLVRGGDDGVAGEDPDPPLAPRPPGPRGLRHRAGEEQGHGLVVDPGGVGGGWGAQGG